jgi:hypothetical protein
MVRLRAVTVHPVPLLGERRPVCLPVAVTRRLAVILRAATSLLQGIRRLVRRWLRPVAAR